jgi:hypothetical protein
VQVRLCTDGAFVDQLLVAIGGNRGHQNHPASQKNRFVYLATLHERLCGRL